MKWLKKEGAFTMLEALVALSITSLILLALSIGVSHFKQVKEELRADRQLDWHLFVNQMSFYLESSDLLSVNQNRLLVKEVNYRDQSVVQAQYRLVNGNFIRRVNNGYQPMLLDVKKVEMEEMGPSLMMKAYFNNDEEYQARIWVNQWHDQENLD
ncbi:competence type IV pilus minor pilin ComGF [Alloiococcus otitis]|mgnify:CR=1 FL=1|nr:competence type IV pilus minor pilin ComGF [Alloiococcus otitis]